MITLPSLPFAMVDIETLSTDNCPVVYQIAAIVLHDLNATFIKYCNTVSAKSDALKYTVTKGDLNEFYSDLRQMNKLSSMSEFINPLTMLGDYRFEVSRSTCEFTFNQNKELVAKAVLSSNDLPTVLNNLSGLLNPFKNEVLVCANSPSFDSVIIRKLYEICDLENTAMSYFKEFDLRTLKHLTKWLSFPQLVIDETIERHDAYNDCLIQLTQMFHFLYCLTFVVDTTIIQE